MYLHSSVITAFIKVLPLMDLSDTTLDRLRNTLEHGLKDAIREEKARLGEPTTLPLYHADPNCDHRVVSAPGGGVKCRFCRGWYCA